MVTGIPFKVERGFKKTIIYNMVGPVISNNINKIKMRLVMLKVYILVSNNIPNKVKRQDVVALLKPCIRVCGTVDH